MESCYEFEEIVFSEGSEDVLFGDSVISATYILYLEGNGRLPLIQEQLKRFRPCRQVYLVRNKGYKKCVKDEWVQRSTHDLTHAYFTAFAHSRSKGYKNVLVLEDDFRWSPRIGDLQVRREISEFVESLQGHDFKYALGASPFFMLHCSWDLRHYWGPYVLSHSVIYSSAHVDQLLLKDPATMRELFDNNSMFNYLYGEPVCYQLLEETENKANWNNPVIDVVIKVLGMDKGIEGFLRLYVLAKWWIPVLIIVLICLVLIRISLIRIPSIQMKSFRIPSIRINSIQSRKKRRTSI
jgi:hypothetical protein